MLKAVVKKPLKSGWRLLEVIRRPFRSKLETFLARTVRDPIILELRGGDRLHNIEQAVYVVSRNVDVLRHDTDLALNSCIREIARLELQLEALREEIEAFSTSERGSGIAQGPVPHVLSCSTSPRAKAE